MKMLSEHLIARAASKYCKAAGMIPKEEIQASILSIDGCNSENYEEVMLEVHARIQYCIAQIHECYRLHTGSHEPALVSLRKKYPEMSDQVTTDVFRHAEWVATK